MRLVSAALAAVSLALPSAGLAAPILALDVRPEVAGIQSALSVVPGQSFYVDLVVGGLGAGDSLQGFQVELALSGGVLTPLDVLDGGFLEFPVAELRREIGSTSILFAEISLGPASTGSTAVLARFELEAHALGAAGLTLPVALLSGPFGEVIPLDEVRGAQVSVPEPGALALLGLALGALTARPRALPRSSRCGGSRRAGRRPPRP